jgi:WD40 repeat protein
VDGLRQKKLFLVEDIYLTINGGQDLHLQVALQKVIERSNTMTPTAKETYFGTFIVIILFLTSCIGTGVERPISETKEIVNTSATADILTPTFEASSTSSAVQTIVVENTTLSAPNNTPVFTATITPDFVLENSPDVANTQKLELVTVLDPNWLSIKQRISDLQGLYTLALSPNGELFAAVESYDEFSKVYLWEVETGSTIWVIELDQALATSKLVFSPDNTKLAVGTSEIIPDIFIWNIENGNQLHHFLYQAHTRDMKFSPDGSLLAVAGLFPGTITVWNLANENVNEIGAGNAIDFIHDSSNSIIAVAKERQFESELPPVYLLDLNSDHRENLFPHDFFAEGIAISPNGQYLATVISNEEGKGNLRVVDLQNDIDLKMEGNEVSHVMQVRQISFSNKGQLGVLQRDLKIWNINGDLIGSLDGLNIKGFIFTPDGSFLITFGNFQNPLEIWKMPAP